MIFGIFILIHDDKYVHIIYMLKIITKNNHFLQRKFIQAFGGSGGPVNVNLEKDAKWIKYKTVRNISYKIESRIGMCRWY